MFHILSFPIIVVSVMIHVEHHTYHITCMYDVKPLRVEYTTELLCKTVFDISQIPTACTAASNCTMFSGLWLMYLWWNQLFLYFGQQPPKIAQ